MNENPEGTPNPLNPGAVMPESVEMPAEPAPAATPEVPPAPAPMEPVSIPEPTQPAIAPMPEPAFEPKDSVVEPAKKKSNRAPLIIIAVLLLLVALGCGIAALVIFKPFASNDAVPSAIAKLMNGAPEHVTANGTIMAVPDGEASIANTGLSIKFSAGFDSKTIENYIDAGLTANLGLSDDFNFTVNEVHTNDGNLYLKLSGVAAAMEQLQSAMPEVQPGGGSLCTTDETTGELICETVENMDGETIVGPLTSQPSEAPENSENQMVVGGTDQLTNCVEDASGVTNCVVIDCQDGSENCSMIGNPTFPVLDSLGILTVIDDEWIRIPDSTFSSISDLGILNSTAQCLIGAAGQLGEYGDDFSKLYEQYPFLTYSTENLKIAKRRDALYKLGFDLKNLTGFINGIGNSGFTNELYACMNVPATNTGITEDDLGPIVAQVPEIYVEINNDNNFTRVYLETTVSQNTCDELPESAETTDACDAKTPGTKLTADISFEYPNSITIKVPNEYIELSTVLSQVLEGFYGIDITQ